MSTKNKIKYPIIIVSLVLLWLLTLGFGINYYLKNKDKPTYNPELVSYLLNNRSQSSDIIDKDKYELFVSGEYHATQKNFDIQMDIIKNLSKNSDLKYIVAEDGMGNALLINQYLQTGDVSNLNTVFKNLKGTFGCNNEAYEFYKNLYEFNKELPNNKKLTYLGIDIEHQSGVALSCFKNIALKNSMLGNEKLETLFTDFDQDRTNEEFILDLEAVYNDVNNNPNMYSEKLGEEFWIFKFLLRNILNTYKCNGIKDDLQWSSLREKSMVENFYEIYNHFPKGKYYGQWGLEHAYLNLFKSEFHPEGELCLAAALNNSEDSPVKNKVCSMAIIYFDSLQMNRNTGLPDNFKSDFSNKQNEMDSLKLFAGNDQSNIQFFKLDSEDSPFLKRLYLFDHIANLGSTTDYFKDIIVVKNSMACTRFDR